jgi:uncharacterized membrane protein
MAENKTVFVFIATYGNANDAWMDYDAVKELHKQKVIGTYDAAVVEKDAEGKIHVHKREKATQHGFWTGAGVGAVVGILFPPSLIGSAVVGGAAGGLIGHLWHGMSRGDMKDLGETLDAGSTALIVLGQVPLTEKMATATTHAQKTTEKQVNVKAKDFDKELAAATPVGS